MIDITIQATLSMLLILFLLSIMGPPHAGC